MVSIESILKASALDKLFSYPVKNDDFQNFILLKLLYKKCKEIFNVQEIKCDGDFTHIYFRVYHSIHFIPYHSVIYKEKPQFIEFMDVSKQVKRIVEFLDAPIIKSKDIEKIEDMIEEIKDVETIENVNLVNDKVVNKDNKVVVEYVSKINFKFNDYISDPKNPKPTHLNVNSDKYNYSKFDTLFTLVEDSANEYSWRCPCGSRGRNFQSVREHLIYSVKHKQYETIIENKK
jgi:hypothetical protein